MHNSAIADSRVISKRRIRRTKSVAESVKTTFHTAATLLSSSAITT
jgi:NAD dependent epimerase/dehydratase family enzyme